MRGTTSEMTARQARVYEAVCAGRTAADIAAAEGVSLETVGRDLKAVQGKLTVWAAARVDRALATALAQLERVMHEAWDSYAEQRAILPRWLAGDYDRTEVHPDPDGGMREVRKPPVLRLEIAALLGKSIEATRDYAKLAGLDKAVALENMPDELLLERARKAGISTARRTG